MISWAFDEKLVCGKREKGLLVAGSGCDGNGGERGWSEGSRWGEGGPQESSVSILRPSIFSAVQSIFTEA